MGIPLHAAHSCSGGQMRVGVAYVSKEKNSWKTSSFSHQSAVTDLAEGTWKCEKVSALRETAIWEYFIHGLPFILPNV